MNFYSLIENAASRADAPCLVRPGSATVSYGQMFERVQTCAGTLEALGVCAGDRVLVQVAKSAENVALYLATLKLGAVYVPINSAYTKTEVAYFLADAEPRVFVCDPAAPHDVPEGVRRVTLGADGTGTLSEVAARARPATAPRDDSDLAAILYTSGTTGRSKGAMLTHGNLSTNAHVLLESWGWRNDDVLLHALPIFHVHGLFVAMHCAMLSATPMIFLPGFDAAEVAGLLPRATVLMGVPTFYTRLLDQPGFDRASAAGMRLFVSGSAPLTATTFETFEERTGHRILERYGMSETLMNVSNPLEGERVPGTVGFALPGVDVRIADAQGRPEPAGTVGGIEVRGPNVFSGYWRLPDKTAEEFRADGFFVTGDLGVMAEDGRVTIVGRAKDLVISGGYNVYPKEVEGLIDELPQVLETAVIGVPHPDFGEGVVAVVVPAAQDVSTETVTQALAGRLARFKQPKIVVNVPELPRNAMGKVQKKALRERFANVFDRLERS